MEMAYVVASNNRKLFHFQSFDHSFDGSEPPRLALHVCKKDGTVAIVCFLFLRETYGVVIMARKRRTL